MLPAFSSLPYNSNQVQIDRTSASVAQQVMPSNQCHENPSWPNSMQIQPQMGTFNPQTAIPFNNTNSNFGNGTIAVPNRPSSAPSPSFINAPNHLFPLQNGVSLLGSSPGGVMSHPGQCQGGFSHQNLNCIPTSVQGMNSVPSMNVINPSQQPGQMFALNPMNMPQYFNQNASMQSGQFYMQSPMQNIYQFVQPQMPPPYGQVVPCSPMHPNNISHAMGPQNPNFMANPQFGLVHTNGAMQAGAQNQHNFVLSTMDVNALKHTPTTTQQQLGGNSSLPIALGSAQSQQVPQNFRPHVLMNSQGNSGKDGGIINSNLNWNNSQNRNWKRNPERDAMHNKISKTQPHHRQNAKGKFGFQKEHGGKGYNNDRARKSGVTNSSNQTPVEQRRSLRLNYTEQEIQQWREERRKNYPSKVHMEKKLIESEVIERCAKLRRQQLKEILAKQAELGCEVAEIPPSYLSDSEKQVNGREVNQRPMTKKERFQNKFNKRGRFRQNDRLAKKQMLADHDSCNVHDQNNRFLKKQKLADNSSSIPSTLSKREPTFLQRLLGADIRRDKTRLLQVLRFTVMNSFFNNWPKEPLRFPLVLVKETGCDGDVVEEKSSNTGRGVSEGSNNTKIEAYEDVNDEDVNNGGGDDDDNNVTNEHDSHVQEVGHFTSLKGCTRKETNECEEEEGEIID
ncbi:uncharacterized protein LOC132300478 [Cornus florida]|uniref:uncharacterized protein LOC132300478 n=1 Tax=Cornus florida TaxID=4283 RepID=UPI00289AA396|nr:uncharacterized protein LOC132300478 [Cornus florida]